LSEVAGAPLPYDELEQLRRRMGQISPSLIAFDEVETVSGSISKLGLEQLSKLPESKLTGSPFELLVKDYYLTNAISRSSSTMAKCSQVFFIVFLIFSHLPTAKSWRVRSPNFADSTKRKHVISNKLGIIK
jgi:hypothetical protein